MPGNSDDNSSGRTAATALAEFEQFYWSSFATLGEAVSAVVRILRSTLDEIEEELAVHDISGRVKAFSSCVQKYNDKYRGKHEAAGFQEPIKEFFTDLIGVRIVCLYEDDIERIAEKVRTTFEVYGETNKIRSVNEVVDRFGYKALHYDFRLGARRGELGEYRKFAGFPVEIQIRTIFQDAWSVLDHQLKYKKSIHPSLSRRINVFAALCELADREFMRIRDDVRAAPAELPSEAINVATESGVLDLKGFIDVLHDNFPTDAILPDQADVLLSIIRRLDPALSKKAFSEIFSGWGARLHEVHEAYKARRRKTLSALTRTRLLLYVADPEKYENLVTSSEMRDLCVEIKRVQQE